MIRVVAGTTSPEDIKPWMSQVQGPDTTIIAVLRREARMEGPKGKRYVVEPLLVAGVMRSVQGRTGLGTTASVSWQVQIAGLHYELARGDVLTLYGPGETVDMDLGFLSVVGTAHSPWVPPEEIEEAVRSIAAEF